MPPDPVIALMALVGLFVYSAIGGVLATIAIRLLDKNDLPSWQSRTRAISDSPGGYKDGWWTFGWYAGCWPLVLPVAIVALAGVTVLIGPIWIARHVGTYLANAQMAKVEAGKK